MRRAPVIPETLPAPGATAPFVLDEAAAHYLRDVLRLRAGARVECFDGQGRALVVRLDEVTPAQVLATPLHEIDRDARESGCQVILAHAIPKGDRWDWALEKATELGVAAVWPLVTARGVVQIPPKKVADRVTRWSRQLASAARQCGRAHTPAVEAPRTLPQALDAAQALDDASHLVAHTGPSLQRLSTWIDEAAPTARVVVWIGPEGGFTEAEVAQLTDAGVHPVSLGPRVLRCETAGVCALSLIQSAWGDL